MNKESKTKYLQAFDLLQSIATARSTPPDPHPHGKGGGAALLCDVCNGARYEANQHSPECPVGNAIKAMGPAMPKPVFVTGESMGRNGRDEYLEDDSQPQITFTPAIQPNP